MRMSLEGNTTAAFNITMCYTIEDFSPASRTISSNRYVLLTMGVVYGMMDAFVLVSNSTLVLALTWSIRSGQNNRMSMTSANISQRSRLLMVSVSICNIVTGGFLMPAAISQMIHNEVWMLGAAACTCKNVGEVQSICVDHVIFMAVDMYVAICYPLNYRMLTVKSSYAMLILAWALPMGIFIIPMLFGFHQRGKELNLFCQSIFGMCMGIFNDMFLILISIFLAMVPFSALLIMFSFILKAIADFHTRLPKDKTRDMETAKYFAKSTSQTIVSSIKPKDNDIEQSSLKTLYLAKNENRQKNRQENVDKKPISTVENIKKEKPTIAASKPRKSNLSDFRKSCRNARAFRYILTLLSWYTLLWVSFFILRLISSTSHP